MRTGESILPRQEAALAAAVPVAAVTVPFVTAPAGVISVADQDTYIIMLLANITETVPAAAHQADVFTAGNREFMLQTVSAQKLCNSKAG